MDNPYGELLMFANVFKVGRLMRVRNKAIKMIGGAVGGGGEVKG